MILISHNHFDHLDYNSVMKLKNKFGDSIDWFVPIGTKSWFTSLGIKETKITDLDWWQSKTIKTLQLKFAPG